jgi:hypothetical protein
LVIAGLQILLGMSMKQSRRQWAVGILVLFSALVASPGCGKREAALPPPVEITGQVVYANGQPVTGMVISFHADDEIAARGRVPSGPLDPEGKFRIVEVTPGRYKATLSPIPGHAAAAADPSQLNAPAKGDRKVAVPIDYLNSGATPWTVTVESPPKPEKLVVNAAGLR